MTILSWFGLAALALILSVVLWWAEGLQREIDRLREKNARLERERDEEIGYGFRFRREVTSPWNVLSEARPMDPTTDYLLDFPEERRAR